jgi:hypothetical protein
VFSFHVGCFFLQVCSQKVDAAFAAAAPPQDPVVAPPRDPAEAARERSHPVEALASDIILALRSDYRVFKVYVQGLTATVSDGSEEDYGDSDGELDIEDEIEVEARERGEAEILELQRQQHDDALVGEEEAGQESDGVTSRALRYINPDTSEEVQVPDHEDVNTMLEQAAGAPGGAHTMNTALEVPQPGETEVVSVMEPIIHQEEQEDMSLMEPIIQQEEQEGSSAPQKRRRLEVEKDASESSIVGSPSSSPCI